VNAVECAIAIQKTMAERNAHVEEPRRMQFRMGVNQRDVIHDEARIYGNGVNVAARLESIAEPGGICISAKVHDEIAGKMNVACQDLGTQHFKNIAQPVRAYHVELLRHSPRPALAVPEKPSIAVLAFTNLSGDPKQEYFADGIVDDIITELSRFSELFVIARNSSFQYKGKAVDARQIGRDLGVRYLLQGSVRRSGSRMRVTVQLIDAESGGHLWAERYNNSLAGVLALQDSITESVVRAIQPQILISEGRRAVHKCPIDLNALDCCMRGTWHFYQGTPQDNRQAESWLRRALEIDPTLARAHVQLGRIFAGRCWVGHSDDLDRDFKASLAAAERALTLDSHDAACHYLLSVLSLMSRRHERAHVAANGHSKSIQT